VITFNDITYRVADAVAHIDVARPEKLNAYRNETADELLAAFRHAEQDPAVRVAVLSGQGRAFGAGYDLSTIQPNEPPQLDHVLEKHFNPLVMHMRETRLPVVATVNGPCAGAAVGIALAADIVIAARTAYFYEPFVGIALVPDAGNTLFLSRMLGRIRASGMMLLGERISAEEAHGWGLVWRVFDSAELMTETDRIASKLATLSPAAVAATKRLIGGASDSGITQQLDLERDSQGEAGRSPEMKAAIAAFFRARTQTQNK
jgi:2-(1,2-epoxy-1,2-dihydrophenyl)acetyl-CoA isomerase